MALRKLHPSYACAVGRPPALPYLLALLQTLALFALCTAYTLWMN